MEAAIARLPCYARAMTALEHLAKADPALGVFIKRHGPLKPKKPDYTEPYEALLSAVAHQQLHGKASASILARLKDHCGGDWPAPAVLLAMPDIALRACGFSGAKTLALRDIAARALDGTIPSRARARHLSDAALIERLITLRGVGQWTVEMLLISNLRRPDVFPVDDFGVREGYRRIHQLEVQPKPKALAVLALAYAPYRTTAALYFWRAADAAKPPKEPSKNAATKPK
jgi:DNA-3-methyladenine glycosylase II